MKILLTGGGTGGSVAPLLAIAEELKETKFPIGNLVSCEFLWIGTRKGIEREMILKEDIKFKSICSGKLRRYFSWRLFIDPFLILIGFFQSLAIQLVWRPSLVISAGSFVSVPVVWAAWILRVPVLIHQQDMRPGLANKLMAPFSRVITVTFEESLRKYGKKAVWTGNPIRRSLISGNSNKAPLIKGVGGIKKDLPVILILGGGTGAMGINKLVWESLGELSKACQIIHSTGKNKIPNSKFQIPNYHYFEFLNSEQMAEAYEAADIVITRAGMGALTELSSLSKASILIPMPDSHQEDNAKVFKDKNAAIVLNQKELTGNILTDNIRKILDDEVLRNKLRNNIKYVIKQGANKEIIKIIETIIK